MFLFVLELTPGKQKETAEKETSSEKSEAVDLGLVSSQEKTPDSSAFPYSDIESQKINPADDLVPNIPVFKEYVGTKNITKLKNIEEIKKIRELPSEEKRELIKNRFLHLEKEGVDPLIIESLRLWAIDAYEVSGL